MKPSNVQRLWLEEPKTEEKPTVPPFAPKLGTAEEIKWQRLLKIWSRYDTSWTNPPKVRQVIVFCGQFFNKPSFSS
jgi:hypothetical protein